MAIKKIRVLIVDDSMFIREFIASAHFPRPENRSGGKGIRSLMMRGIRSWNSCPML